MRGVVHARGNACVRPFVLVNVYVLGVGVGSLQLAVVTMPAAGLRARVRVLRVRFGAREVWIGLFALFRLFSFLSCCMRQLPAALYVSVFLLE